MNWLPLIFGRLEAVLEDGYSDMTPLIATLRRAVDTPRDGLKVVKFASQVEEISERL